MDRNEDEIPFEGYSQLHFPDIDAFLDNDKVFRIEELNKMLIENTVPLLEPNTEDTLIENLLAQMSDNDLELLQEVIGGELTVNDEHSAVQTAADLIAHIPNQGEVEDEIQAAPKRRRIVTNPELSVHQELEQTLFVRDSNFGSSSMYARQATQACTSLQPGGSSQPVLDHSSSACLQDALKQFYETAYEWFEMAPPPTGVDISSTEPACVPDHQGHGTQSLDTHLSILPKLAISEMLVEEMRKGRDLRNMVFVSAFAKFLLEQQKFKDLCLSCGTFYRNPKVYVKHLVKGSGKFRCLYRCGTTFTRTDTLRKHMRQHHGRGAGPSATEFSIFRCDVPGCDHESPSRAGLFQHTRIVHGSGLAPCPICRIVVDSQAAMNAHMLTAHGLQAGQPLPFECDVDGCTARCRTESGLQQHKRRVHAIPK